MIETSPLERYRAISAEKAGGVTYTPKILADFVAREIVRFATDLPTHRPVRVLDPALGQGELLVSLLEALSSRRGLAVQASGFETDPELLDVTVSRVTRRFPHVRLRLECGSFLDFVLQQFGDDDQENLFGKGHPGAYDLIIANPPYVRTQIMGAARARLLAKQFGLTGRIDMYYAFLVAISRVLDSAGTAGLIVSNRFMTTKSGSRVRNKFLRCFRLRGVWDLGDTKLFDAAVLPAVVIADGKSNRDAAVPSFTSIYETAQPADKRADDPIHAVASEGVLEIQDGRRFRVRHGLLDTNGTSDGVWRIATRRVDNWLATVEKNSWSTFGEIGKIRVGVKTCADKVFIRDDWAEMPEFDRPELLKPLTTHRVARRFKPLAAVRPIHILYPHEVSRGRRRVIDLETYPRSKAYLNAHRPRLTGRRYVTEAGRRWYEIWVPQDPGAWAHAKLVFRDITAKPTFWLDLSGTVVNGDCYWLTCRNAERTDLLWLAAAVGNSTFIERFYDRRFHNKLYAGRRRFITQYVQHFPLPDPASVLGASIIAKAKQVYDLTPSDEAIQLQAELNAMVWKSFELVVEVGGG